MVLLTAGYGCGEELLSHGAYMCSYSNRPLKPLKPFNPLIGLWQGLFSGKEISNRLVSLIST
jgi:hypothetical protein